MISSWPPTNWPLHGELNPADEHIYCIWPAVLAPELSLTEDYTRGLHLSCLQNTILRGAHVKIGRLFDMQTKSIVPCVRHYWLLK